MAQVSGSLFKLTAIVGGQEIDLTNKIITADFQVDQPSAEELVEFEQVRRSWREFRDNIVGRTLTLSFAPSPEFLGIVVGIQLQYGLRDLHRNLGRYAQWPYTN